MAATKSKGTKKAAAQNGVAATADVLTLAEAAAFLRVAESAVIGAVTAQGLPGRQLGGEWRFLKSSLRDWLNRGPRRFSKEAFMALAGVWKDDPYVDEMLEDIYKKRGRPMLEDEE